MATGGRVTRSKAKASGDFNDHVCSPCKKRIKTNEGVKFCVECQEFLCHSCVYNHSSSSSLTEHSFLNKSQFRTLRQSPLRNVSPLPTEKCKLHSMKLMDKFCANHDVVGCSDCFNIDHKKCKDVHYIPEYIKESKPSLQMSVLQSQVSAAIDRLECLMKRSKNTKEELETNRASSLQGIQEFRKELNKALDRLEQETAQNINNQYYKLDEILKTEMANIQSMLDHLRRSKTSLELSTVNTAQKFVTTKICKCDVAESENLLSRCVVPEPMNKSFKGNHAILEFLETFQSLDLKTCQPVQQLETKCNWYKLDHVDTSNIKIPTDKETCEVWSICLLDSFNILMADRKNKVLKLMDGESYAIKDSLKFDHEPSAVCKGRGQEAIVCLSNKSIQFVSFQDKLKHAQTIAMDHYCLGICMVSAHIFVTDGQEGNIFKYDMEGNLLKKISGQTIFLWNRFLVGSDDENAIFVTDRDNGLIKMDLEGNVIWKHPLNIFKGAFGLCSDGLGSVLVTCFQSGSIVQLGADGKCLVDLNKDTRLINPSGISFDKQTSKLFVAGYDTDKLLIYSLQPVEHIHD